MKGQVRKHIKRSLWVCCILLFGWMLYSLVSHRLWQSDQKYEKNKTHKDIGFFQFTKKHFKKLFLLMIIPYVIYLLLHWNFINLKAVFAQSLMISNLYSSLVHPGIYWYFGLMLQLYIAYYLFIFNKADFGVQDPGVFDKNSLDRARTFYNYAYNPLHNSRSYSDPDTAYPLVFRMDRMQDCWSQSAIQILRSHGTYYRSPVLVYTCIRIFYRQMES